MAQCSPPLLSSLHPLSAPQAAGPCSARGLGSQPWVTSSSLSPREGAGTPGHVCDSAVSIPGLGLAVGLGSRGSGAACLQLKPEAGTVGTTPQPGPPSLPPTAAPSLVVDFFFNQRARLHT